jgi:hypothetical protein
MTGGPAGQHNRSEKEYPAEEGGDLRVLDDEGPVERGQARQIRNPRQDAELERPEEKSSRDDEVEERLDNER